MIKSPEVRISDVENEEELFLKTIIPSRKAAQRYLGEKHED